ncbi:UNVERIFIED_CONTAM: protein trichome birefringence-like 8 [Sesamum angustifolium]|uniref:Protein trichome birefringence-like 8 n=1 Tax=Sesamum angustifolium TaxID=2727405 RepID=A0AAW2MSV7_9LAMI
MHLHFLSLSIPNKKLTHFLIIFFSLTLTSILCYVVFSPFQPVSLFNIGFLYQILPEKPRPRPCDYSNGKWVWDETLPDRRYTEKCPFLDPGFRCHESGRQDLGYQKWRWQPQACNLPRFDANDFLERSRNGRIVFAGDSIGRNQWESLICMLAQGVSNYSTIYEEHGNPITKHKGSSQSNFKNTTSRCSTTYSSHRSTTTQCTEEVRGVIRVDKLHWFSDKWIGADVLVFSAGHWWNQDKTLKSLKLIYGLPVPNLSIRGHYFQEKEGGEWNKGGTCNMSREPETDYSKLGPEPPNNIMIYEVVEQMKSAMRTINFLNITYLTEFRKDGHPSSNREPGTPADAPEDCSHWCLPGVPDTWNELLYAELLRMKFRTRTTGR